jgi:hypothetical protein
LAGIGNPGASVSIPSAEFREISSALSSSSGRHGSGSPLTSSLVVCAKLWNWPFARPLPFLSAYKRAAFRLWDRRGRRFLVALSPPLLSPVPCLSIGAPKAGRHHHLKEAKRAHGRGEETNTSHSIHARDRSRRYSCCTCTLCLFFVLCRCAS